MGVKRLRGLCTLLLLLALLGCTRAETRPRPHSPSVVTVRVGLTEGDVSGEYLDILITAFQAEYPQYRVEKVGYPFDPYSTATWPDLAKGELDLASSHQGGPESGYEAELAPYMQQSALTAEQFGGLRDTHLRSVKRLPYVVTPYVIGLNTDMVKQAGLPLPSPDWTWEQLRSVAAGLSGRRDGEWRYGLSASEELARAWLLGKGNNLDPRAVQEAMTYFHALLHTDRAMPPVIPIGSAKHGAPPERPNFLQGQTAMGYVPWFTTRPLPFKAAYLPVPVHPGGRRVAMSGSLWLAMSSASRRQEAAWAFLSFAVSDRGALALARAGIMPAVWSEAVAEAWMASQTTDREVARLLAQTEWISGWNGSPFGGPFFAVNQLMSGRMTVEEAMEEYLKEEP